MTLKCGCVLEMYVFIERAVVARLCLVMLAGAYKLLMIISKVYRDVSRIFQGGFHWKTDPGCRGLVVQPPIADESQMSLFLSAT